MRRRAPVAAACLQPGGKACVPIGDRGRKTLGECAVGFHGPCTAHIDGVSAENRDAAAGQLCRGDGNRHIHVCTIRTRRPGIRGSCNLDGAGTGRRGDQIDRIYRTVPRAAGGGHSRPGNRALVDLEPMIHHVEGGLARNRFGAVGTHRRAVKGGRADGFVDKPPKAT